MCRKLTLVGWVTLVEEEFEQLRVLIALLISITFLTMHFAVKPFKRCVSGFEVCRSFSRTAHE
jgi:hypothetical protein